MIISFLNENFANPISLKEACIFVANLSESYAEKIFRQEVGLPIKKYLILKRLYEAARLLRSDPKLSEYDVISCCGFNDVSNFIKQFKNHLGCTPIRFKNCNLDPESCSLWKISYFHRLLKNSKLRKVLNINISQLCLLSRIIKTNT